ncbi:MAG: AAA family ATPase [Pseudomonadota bacterium]
MSIENAFANYGAALIQAGYRILPTIGKKPCYDGWQNSNIDQPQFEQLKANGAATANLGVVCGVGEVPIHLVDIDSEDPDVVRQLRIYADENLGLGIERVGKAPKLGLIFRGSGFRKVTSKSFIDQQGRRHRLEVLGHGQQFVLAGIHPDTGRPYEHGDFLERKLWEISPKELPELTTDGALAIVTEFERLARAKVEAGEWTPEAGAGRAARAPAVVNPDDVFIPDPPVQDLSPAQIEEVCSHWDVETYDGITTLGMALHHQFDGADEGLILWDKLGSKALKYAGFDWYQEKWTSFGQDANRREITLRTLIAHANSVRPPAQARATPTASKFNTAERILLTPLTSVKPAAVDWIWPGWLAKGMLHILAGAPGTGKTNCALALAATKSKGGTLPDGSRVAAGRVAIWSGEDDLAHVIVPRLITYDANLNNIVSLAGATNSDGSRRPFDPATDMPLLAETLRDSGGLDLLVIDPIVSAVAGDSHKNAEVRRSLQPLVDLGQEFGTAILGITHYTKSTAGRDPVERVTGSIAFGALARIVLATAKLPDDQGGGRIFARAKSNIGPDGGGFGYHLDVVQVADGIETTMVRWGDPLTGTARDLLAAAEQAPDQGQGHRGDAIQACQAFLANLLADGPKLAIEIKAAAEAECFSDATLRRAKAALGVESARKGNQWYWQLWAAKVAP